jgi:hypothetical protein
LALPTNIIPGIFPTPTVGGPFSPLIPSPVFFFSSSLARLNMLTMSEGSLETKDEDDEEEEDEEEEDDDEEEDNEDEEDNDIGRASARARACATCSLDNIFLCPFCMSMSQLATLFMSLHGLCRRFQFLGAVVCT